MNYPHDRPSRHYWLQSPHGRGVLWTYHTNAPSLTFAQSLVGSVLLSDSKWYYRVENMGSDGCFKPTEDDKYKSGIEEAKRVVEKANEV
jgi:hypothetical protein